MATFKTPKKVKKKHKHDIEGRAFDMYVTLNSELKHVYSNSQIAKELNISLKKFTKWRKKGRWKERLKEAIEKGRARAANSEQMKDLLTSYLYGEQALKEVGVDPAKVIEALERKKSKRITRVVRYMGDIIYEVRAYNHMMFRALMAKADSDKYPTMAMPIKDRDSAHRAWMDSLAKLMDLFGVTTIKNLAMELMSNELLNEQLKENPQSPAGVAVNVNIGGVAPKTIGDVVEGATYVISAEAAEHVMHRVAQEGGAKIGGPIGYTGPKEKNVFDGAEDAVVTQQRRPDSEGEE